MNKTRFIKKTFQAKMIWYRNYWNF